jgi:uncharacterized membrane protein (UPF0182 family)
VTFRTPGFGRRLRTGRSRLLLPVVTILAVLVMLFLVFTAVWTDLLWYRSVGFSSVYTTQLRTKVVLFVGAGLFVALVVGLNMVIAYRLRPPYHTLSVEQQSLERYRLAIDPYRKIITLAGLGLLGLLTGSTAAGQWRLWLAFTNRTPFGTKDPQFHQDISFFVFTYPFLRMILGYLFFTVIFSIFVAIVVHYLYGGLRLQSAGDRASPGARVHMSVLLGTFVLLKAVAYWFDRWGLAHSERGVVTGPSYTDVNAVLPAKTILAVIAVLCALLFFANIWWRGAMLLGVSLGLLLLSAILVGAVYPAMIQQFQVKPNEAGKEAPYIDRNIKATRAAYGVDRAEVSANYSAQTTPSESELAKEASTVAGVRLLDPALVSKTYQQLQQIRGFYRFPDQLDIDRYPSQDGTVHDTVVSVRELTGPPQDQNNWINRHLIYTHGYGFVAAPGNEVDPSGLPAFSAKDMPPTGPLVQQTGLKEPRVYFGENSPEYSIVGAPPGTRPTELDFPESGGTGQKNTTYTGNGGVSVGSFINRLLYAVKYGEPNMLLSGSVNDRSQILYHRDPRERIERVAPFLNLDGNPYPAVVGGRILWIVDAYTMSDGYPYSEKRSLAEATMDTATAARRVARQPTDNINYMRNSVKATVDAYSGAVTLYTWDDKDPILRTWKKAFPGTVKPQSAISPELRQHLRYPNDLFKVQRDILSRYHVRDAQAFYGGQDFWNIPNDPTDSRHVKQPPYYLSLKMPGDSAPSFSLTTTFVPRQRPNMAAFMAVDASPTGGSYGRLRILQLPGNTAIQGPGQAQNTFNSDAKLSQDLNLLRGQGQATAVTNGNLLSLPFGGGFLYVQPVYVQAAQTAGQEPYPILRRVAVMFGNQVGFGPSLQDALNQVFKGAAPPSTGAPPGQGAGQGAGQLTGAMRAAIAQATEAYEAGQRALAKTPQDWQEYGRQQQRLKEALDRLGQLQSQAPAAGSSPAANGGGATPSPSPSPSASPSPGG